jgi:hypothetical protein
MKLKNCKNEKLKKETLFLSLVCGHTNNVHGMGSSIKCP